MKVKIRNLTFTCRSSLSSKVYSLALFSDHKDYRVLWKSRVGFARIALEAKVPVIPVFTRNIREAVRTFSFGKSLMRAIYNRFRLPCAPIYGGWPVKLTTYIGDPIPYDPNDTPESLRDKCKDGIESLIHQHQRVPGSICMALFERVTRKRHTS
jgi:1-acyl-sn-glycerol-3-phosphate acyltransferase